MTDNEIKLMNIIREHNDPAQAVEIAIKTIVEFLAQGESSQEQPLACSRESA